MSKTWMDSEVCGLQFWIDSKIQMDKRIVALSMEDIMPLCCLEYSEDMVGLEKVKQNLVEQNVISPIGIVSGAYNL